MFDYLFDKLCFLHHQKTIRRKRNVGEKANKEKEDEGKQEKEAEK